MPNAETSYGDVITAAGGPFRIERDTLSPERVAPELFKYMQACRQRLLDTEGEAVPGWVNAFAASLNDLKCDPEGVARLGQAYASAREAGFVVEPENPSDTPCGKSATQVFDEQVAKAASGLANLPQKNVVPDPRLSASKFGFEGSDLRAIWCLKEKGQLLSAFLQLVNANSGTDKKPPVPPVGSIELWRAFLAFEDPLKSVEAPVSAIGASEGSAAETASEDASSFPEWVRAEDRWERLMVLYEQLSVSTKAFNFDDPAAIYKALLKQYDVTFLMGFDPERLRALLPHLIERARLSAQDRTLFQEAGASWMHPALPQDPSVYAMPPHALVAHCWLTPDSYPLTTMKEEDVEAIFGGSIHPNTFSVLRTFIGEGNFKQLGVDKIRFADRLRREQRLRDFIEFIKPGAFIQSPLETLEHSASLGTEFFRAVAESPKISDDTGDDADDPDVILYEQALSRLRSLGNDERTAVEDLILKVNSLHTMSDTGRQLQRMILRQGQSPREVAFQLIRTVPVERLARLSSHHYAVLLQYPELQERLDVLEQIPSHWLAVALNVHLEKLPTLDGERIRRELVELPASTDDDGDAKEWGKILKDIKDGARDERYDDFDALMRNWPAKMEDLLRCPEPKVLCDFVEHCGGVDVAKRELGMDVGMDVVMDPTYDNPKFKILMGLMVHREDCRAANYSRRLAASLPHTHEIRLPNMLAYTDPPKNDVWHETPREFHDATGFEFRDMLRHGYPNHVLARLFYHHQFVARLVQFVAEQRQSAGEEDMAEKDDLMEVPL